MPPSETLDPKSNATDRSCSPGSTRGCAGGVGFKFRPQPRRRGFFDQVGMQRRLAWPLLKTPSAKKKKKPETPSCSARGQGGWTSVYEGPFRVYRGLGFPEP